MITAMSAAKRSNSVARQFQESCTADVGFVCRNDRAVGLCTLGQDDSKENQRFKKALSRCENRVAFHKSRSQDKSKHRKKQQSFRKYRQAREIFYAVT